jgi:hypothetical protein
MVIRILDSLAAHSSKMRSPGSGPRSRDSTTSCPVVQFLPTFASVQEEAVAQARRVTYAETHTYIFTPEHLGAELLLSGRRKDHARVIDLIESGQVDMSMSRQIIHQHGLAKKWKEFAARFNLEE